MAKDPRRKKLERAVAKTANDILFEDALRHATLIERWRGGLSGRIDKLVVSKVLPGLMQQIEQEIKKVSAGKKLPTRLKRLRRMEAILRTSANESLAETRKLLRSELVNTAMLERDFQAKSILKASGPLALKMDIPDVQTLRTLVTKQPFQGGTLGQWMSGLNKRLATVARQEVTIGVTNGESISEIARRLHARVPGQLRRDLKAIVRTAVTSVTTATRETTYRNNDELVKGVRYVATLDLRTTSICASLDGKVFEIDEGPRPPLHFNCRSTTIPILKSWEELGIPAKDIAPTTRASMDGQVPAQQTYGTWLKNQPAALQDEALGRTRGRLFRQGKIQINSLIDQQFRPLNLEQIRKMEGLTKEDIKLIQPPKQKKTKTAGSTGQEEKPVTLKENRDARIARKERRQGPS